MLTETSRQENLLLGGKESGFIRRETLRVFYPADGVTEVGECPLLSEGDLPAVEEAAQNGFERFKRVPVVERVAILTRLADLILSHQAEFSRLITLETGKPIRLSTHEVQRAISVFRGYAHQLELSEGKTYFVEGREARVQYFPIGPVLAITPYNFPLNLVAHKLAPAIAAGCSITIKPASKTPLTALLLGRLALEAGYEALSVIPCRSDLAERLVQSDVFRKLSFTGSGEVGWRLKSLAEKKSVTLELGGNAACVVQELSEPVATIATRLAQGGFWLSGQSCVSLQRLYVNEAVYDELIPALIDATRAMKVGDPLLPETDMGPMITLDDVHRTRRIIKEAIFQGANVLYGGNTFNAFTMNPTLMNRTTPDMAVNAEECFAPIVTVAAYADFDEALARVNDSRFGLQAGVYTNDHRKAMRAYEVLDVGGVVINDVPTFRADALPYGGVKDSGMGREGVVSGIEEMSTVKTLIFKP